MRPLEILMQQKQERTPRHMDTKKCEACLMAASLGSFTAAADELGYTQSGNGCLAE